MSFKHVYGNFKSDIKNVKISTSVLQNVRQDPKTMDEEIWHDLN